MSEPRRISHECQVELRGMGFHPPAMAIIQVLKPGASLQLEREPRNKYDGNAIKVWVEPSAVEDDVRPELELLLAGYGIMLEAFDASPAYMLGYVGKEWAVELAPRLDRAGSGAGGEAYSARLAFDGKGKPQVRVELYD